jgi:hypothetical protein
MAFNKILGLRCEFSFASNHLLRALRLTGRKGKLPIWFENARDSLALRAALTVETSPALNGILVQL